MSPENASMRGIALKVSSVGVFLIMSSLLKATQGIPAGELVFFRSLFAIVPILVFLAARGELVTGFGTRHMGGHFWRGLVGTVSMGLGFFALTRLPLPEAVTIGYATPLIIVVFSAVFLHEQVRLYRWSAVVVGFIGVGIIVWPRLSILTSGAPGDVGTTVGVVAALTGCVTAAVAMLLVRALVKTEASATVVLYFSLSSTVIALVTVPFGWVMPDGVQAAELIGAGIAGGIAQILLTESYRQAEMSVIAPFEYSSLLFSVAIGYAFFGDVPTINMWIGGFIVIGSGLFIILREHRLGLDRAKARQSVTPQG